VDSCFCRVNDRRVDSRGVDRNILQRLGASVVSRLAFKLSGRVDAILRDPAVSQALKVCEFEPHVDLRFVSVPGREVSWRRERRVFDAKDVSGPLSSRDRVTDEKFYSEAPRNLIIEDRDDRSSTRGRTRPTPPPNFSVFAGDFDVVTNRTFS